MPAPELDCPDGFARSQLLQINPRFDDYACALLAEEPPLPGGGGNAGGGTNGGGGTTAPLEITQDFEQESEAGEVDQTFDIS